MLARLLPLLSRTLRFSLVLILLSGTATAGEWESGSGLGGTGHAADGPGIGGTGLTMDGQEADGTGLGGTGRVADGGTGIGGTGLIGTITAFGSIWVNGEEVHYSEDLPVGIYERQSTPQDLRIGQVVEVEADERQGRLMARRIDVRHAVAGVIESIDRQRNEIVVLGQHIRLPEDDATTSNLRVGDRIGVSGLRDGQGRIIASHLDTPPEGTPAFVRGPVERIEGDRMIIGGAEFELPAGQSRQGLTRGREVTLYGRQEGSRLRPTRMKLAQEIPFAGRVERLSVEGFVGPQGRRIAGLRLPDGAKGFRPGQRIVIDGRIGRNHQLRRDGLKIRSAPFKGRRKSHRPDDVPKRQDATRPPGTGRGMAPPGARARPHANRDKGRPRLQGRPLGPARNRPPRGMEGQRPPRIRPGMDRGARPLRGNSRDGKMRPFQRGQERFKPKRGFTPPRQRNLQRRPAFPRKGRRPPAGNRGGGKGRRR